MTAVEGGLDRTVVPAGPGAPLRQVVATPTPPVAERDAPRGRDLDHILVRSLAWTGTMKVVAQVAGWASTLIVARILAPEDYGLLAMAGVYLGIVTIISEFGLGASIVNLRELSSEQIAQLNGLTVLLGTVSVLLSWALARPVAAFYGAPEVALLVVVLSAAFVFTALQTVPGALLQKELRFRALAMIDGVQACVSAVVMVSLALLGFGYWTLVAGGLAAGAVRTVLILALRRHSFALPRPPAVGKAVRFGRDVLGSRLSWYGYSNADFLIAGRVLGKDALGAYSFAWTLASLPVEKVSTLVTQVTPAFFSAVQTDPAALRRYLLTLTDGLVLITLPAAIGLALVAEDLVLTLLGPKWEAAIMPLRLLALYVSIRSVAVLFGPVLNATGEARYAMWSNLVALVILPAGFLVGSRWGVVGIAWAWIALYPIVMALLLHRVRQRIELSIRSYLSCFWPAFSAAIPMAVAVLLLQKGLATAPGALRLAATVLAGAAVYAALLMWLYPARLALLRSLIRRGRSSAAAEMAPTVSPDPLMRSHP